MNITSIFFSATGTTRKIVRAVAEGVSHIVNTSLTEIDVTHRPAEEASFASSNLMIIAVPVYGGKMSPVAKARMQYVSGNNTPCVLIAVYGNRAFENTLSDMAEYFAAKGFMPVACGAFVGEHSYSTDEMPIAENRPDETDLKDAVAFGNTIGARLVEEKLSAIKPSALKEIPSPEKSLENFISFVKQYSQSQKEHPVKYLPEVDIDTCVQCGRCVNVCPMEAIADDCHTLSPDKCIKCAACVKICPAGARSLFTPFAPVLSENFNIRKPAIWTVG